MELPVHVIRKEKENNHLYLEFLHLEQERKDILFESLEETQKFIEKIKNPYVLNFLLAGLVMYWFKPPWSVKNTKPSESISKRPAKRKVESLTKSDIVICASSLRNWERTS